MLKLLLYFLLVNAGTLSRERSISFNRIAIPILLYSGILVFIAFEDFNAGIGIYGGLFQTIFIRHSSIQFISKIGAMVFQLTAFLYFTAYLSAFSIHTDSYLEIYKKKLISKMGEQSVVIEYPLIIFFILLRVIFFILLRVLRQRFILFLLFVLPLLYLEDVDGFVLLLVPVVTYSYPDTQKDQIYSDNKHKASPSGGGGLPAGVYLWRNQISGKIYIGSAVNLSNRLSHYFSAKFMEAVLKRSKSAIYSAILNLGISFFKLEILEYCSREECIKIEQKYINLLQPSYNILKIAGSSLGITRSEETRAKMSVANKGKNNPMFGKTGKTPSEETRAKMSAWQMGVPKSVEHKEKLSLGNPNCKKIEVTDLYLNSKTTYNSINKAAKSLNLRGPKIISQYISRKQQIPFIGRYIFRRVADR
jgi:group I intron endonuclease